ncbi:hypothetical protein CANCADRAFT_109262 [Tortispora caseinolytica NRRL Y-17796]|uniref:PHD-type domain-containing protein n=1 Tax=Tortispora caseinolytica NRRL Y-17796 TaxID=767744 RepID=A0A1E4TG33_9ASCO|nr:hypothetical protein CANCADRAFT_109262 [Tortispora caseinolytica NRRL Y-17796]
MDRFPSQSTPFKSTRVVLTMNSSSNGNDKQSPSRSHSLAPSRSRTNKRTWSEPEAGNSAPGVNGLPLGVPPNLKQLNLTKKKKTNRVGRPRSKPTLAKSEQNAKVSNDSLGLPSPSISKPPLDTSSAHASSSPALSEDDFPFSPDSTEPSNQARFPIKIPNNGFLSQQTVYNDTDPLMQDSAALSATPSTPSTDIISESDGESAAATPAEVSMGLREQFHHNSEIKNTQVKIKYEHPYPRPDSFPESGERPTLIRLPNVPPAKTRRSRKARARSARASTPEKSTQNRIKKSPTKHDRRLSELNFRHEHGPETPTELRADSASNDDFCSVCKQPGTFICCDNCPKSFHFLCLDPPLEEDQLPEDDSWFCTECSAAKYPPSPSTVPIFGPFIDIIAKRNPKTFLLPKIIRDRYEGVATASDGSYMDSREHSRQLNRNGQPEDSDPHKLRDKNGNLVYCYKCGLSAIDLQIISCDYCSLHWHLDCLNPPMVSIPRSSRKWMCPAHALHITPKRRIAKKSRIVDVTIPRNFRNSGYIELTNDTDDEMNDDYDRFNVDGITYRLPERAVKLDFIEHAKLKSYYELVAKQLDSQKEYASLSTLDALLPNDYHEREALSGLAYLRTANSPVSIYHKNVLSLLHAIQFVEESEDSQRYKKKMEALTRGSHESNFDDLSIEDKMELMAVRQIIRAKGKDALYDFLLS